MNLRYRVVDVFTTQALEGNPLAVFPEAAGIDDVTMQRIAKELNLAETAFVLPPAQSDHAANVRIFTPVREMIFAGHPTIGTAFVLLDEGIVQRGTARFVLEEKVGPVPIRVESGDRPMIWLQTPPIRDGKTYERKAWARALGLDFNDLLDISPQLLSAGNPTVYVPVKNVETVDRASLDARELEHLLDGGDPICVFVFAPTPKGAYSRMFAPEYGIVEDPATGSSTGPLAAFMMRHGLASSCDGTRFVSEQGVKMGRRSLLHVEIHGEQGSEGIDVGGHVTPLIDATMYLPAR
jgi:trans-2,3-dihydro-3-hydroxyanthranilate isomerase